MHNTHERLSRYNAYEYFGHHHVGDRVVFRLWAPSAEAVSLVGDFNYWTVGEDPFRKLENGIWETSIETARICYDCKYKFALTSKGQTRLKADPYAFFGETRTHTASIIWKSGYEWSDGGFLNARKEISSRGINIYAIHPASWQTRDGRDNSKGDAYLNFREIAERLIPYVKKMGYTHVELTPIMEHPDDKSLGYRTCSYYAPSSRYGNPDDFKHFVNELHRAGIGVILDGVPDRFPKDEHGLWRFDGSPLYETENGDEAIFDLRKPQVEDFIISNALFWLKEYHLDGLCVASNGCNDLEDKLGRIIKKEQPDTLFITGEDVKTISYRDVSFEDSENIEARLAGAVISPLIKRTVMGCEFASQKPWEHIRQLDWHLTELPRHAEIQLFISKLNHFYIDNSSLFGEYTTVAHDTLQIYRYGKLTVIANLTEETAEYTDEGRVIFSYGYEGPEKSTNFCIPPHGAVIIKPIIRKERHNV